MVKTKNSSKIIAIFSALIMFLSLAFAILPNLDNSTSTQVQASTLTEAQLQQRRDAPGLYQTGTTTLITSWADLISNGKIITNNTTNTSMGTFYVPDKTLAGDLVCGAVDNLTSLKNSFNGCSNLTAIDLSNFDTSNVTEMNVAFCDCFSVTTIIFGSNFSTSNVENMNNMFCACTSLQTIDLSNFNTSSVTNMSAMFSGCNLTTLNISSFDFSSVTNTTSMFGMDKQGLMEEYGLESEQADAVLTKSTPEEKANELFTQLNYTPEMLGEYYEFTFQSLVRTFSTDIDQIIVPTTALPSGLQIALPTTYNSVVNGVTGADEINYLISGANTTLVKATSGVVDTGIATDLFSFAVTGLIIIALAVISLRKKKVSK